VYEDLFIALIKDSRILLRFNASQKWTS